MHKDKEVKRLCEFCYSDFMTPDHTETCCTKCFNRMGAAVMRKDRRSKNRHDRTCQKCGTKLHPTRYFHCSTCVRLVDDHDVYLYHRSTRKL